MSGVDDITQLIVPPGTAQGTVVLQTFGHGTFVSTDFADMFVPLLPMDRPRLTQFVGAVVGADGAPDAGHRPYLVGAGSSLSPSGSVLVDVGARLLQPVVGPPKPAAAYAVSPDYVHDGNAVAFVNGSSSTGSQVEIYRCDKGFACSARVATLATNYMFDRAWFLSPDALVVAVKHQESSRPRLYVSTNGARSFTSFTTGQKLIDGQSASGEYAQFEFTASRSGLRSWLRIYGRPGARPPASRLYESRDHGRTWRLTAFARIEERGPRGTLPDFRVPGQWFTPRVLLQGSDGGRVFIGGLSRAGWDLACSLDSGMHWRTACA